MRDSPRKIPAEADCDRRWAIPRCGVMPDLSMATRSRSFLLAGQVLQLQSEEESVAGDYLRLMSHLDRSERHPADTLLTVAKAAAGTGWDVGLGKDRCYAGGDAETLLPKLMKNDPGRRSGCPGLRLFFR
ncbi:MAG: hypothetical protein P8X63_03315 [Desulfuromonadaceae bacterium]